MPSQTGAAREVVLPESQAEGPGQASVDDPAAAQDGHDERQGYHQLRGVAQQPLALGERLVHEAEFALLEVAQAPVHQLRGLRRRPRRQVRLVDEGYRQAAGGGVEGDARSCDATADDE